MKQDTIEKLNNKLRDIERVFEEATLKARQFELELEKKENELVVVETNLKRVMLERDDYKKYILFFNYL